MLKSTDTMVKNLKDAEPTCPFKIGDEVVFSPNERTIGWCYPTFDRVRLKPGDIGIVTRIEKAQYLYLDDERGGFHWQCFRKKL